MDNDFIDYLCVLIVLFIFSFMFIGCAPIAVETRVDELDMRSVTLRDDFVNHVKKREAHNVTLMGKKHYDLHKRLDDLYERVLALEKFRSKHALRRPFLEDELELENESDQERVFKLRRNSSSW